MTGLIAVGIVLRLWAYLARQSLWLDEILLASNIVTLPLNDLLTQPLLLDQVAPRGYLLLEKFVVLTLGSSELSLRLVAFLCGVAALLLFRRLAERMLDGWGPVIAMGLFAIAIPLIKFGAEVKQYELDALATVVLLLTATRLPEYDGRRLVLAGLLGFVVSWFSQASVIVMAGIGLALAIHWLMTRERQTARALLMTVPIWAVSCVLAVLAGRRSMTPSTQAFMDAFWGAGYLPLPATPFSALSWLWAQGLSLFTDPLLLRYSLPALFLVVATAGLAVLPGQRRYAGLLLLGPFVIALSAAVAHQYPMRSRLMFYLIPLVLLALAHGVELLRRAASRLHRAAGWLVVIALSTPPALALARHPPPYDIEGTRTLLRFLQQHRRPGDVVYALPLSRIGLLYYGPRYGLMPDEWVTWICEPDDTRAYLHDVNRFRGAGRFWLWGGGARAFRPARSALQRYLGTIGVRQDSLVLPSLSWGMNYLELYDLGDSTRWRAADPETFPVTAMPTDPRPGCRPWIQPSALDSIVIQAGR